MKLETAGESPVLAAQFIHRKGRDTMSNTQRVEGHTPTIKDCPCCGDEAYDNVSGCIMCGTCGLHAESIQTWNRRASIERLEKVNEALVTELMAANAQMESAAECIEKGRYDEALLHVRSMSGKRAEVIRLAEEPA